jgi:hypothetical protein
MPASLVVNDNPASPPPRFLACPVSLINAGRFGFFHSLSGCHQACHQQETSFERRALVTRQTAVPFVAPRHTSRNRDSMKKPLTSWISSTVGIAALIAGLTVPATAQTRDDRRDNRTTERRDTPPQVRRSVREGRVTSVTRSGKNYRLRLSGSSQTYLVGRSAFGGRTPKVGSWLRLTVTQRGGQIQVEDVTWTTAPQRRH